MKHREVVSKAFVYAGGFGFTQERFVEELKRTCSDFCLDGIRRTEEGIFIIPARTDETRRLRVRNREILVGESVPYHTDYVLVRALTPEMDLEELPTKTYDGIWGLFPDSRSVDVELTNRPETIGKAIKEINQEEPEQIEGKSYNNTLELIADGVIKKRELDSMGLKNASTDRFISMYENIVKKVDELYLTLHQGLICFPQARLWIKKPEYKEVSERTYGIGPGTLHADWSSNEEIAILETALGKESREFNEWFIPDDKEKAEELNHKYEEAIQKGLDDIAVGVIRDREPLEVIENSDKNSWNPNLVVGFVENVFL